MVIAITVMAITICKYNAILLTVQAFRAIISHHLLIILTADGTIPISIPHSTPPFYPMEIWIREKYVVPLHLNKINLNEDSLEQRRKSGLSRRHRKRKHLRNLRVFCSPTDFADS